MKIGDERYAYTSMYVCVGVFMKFVVSTVALMLMDERKLWIANKVK